MIIVPLILGLGAIYVLVYGSRGNSDLPPIDTLGSMQPYEEPHRPAPVAKLADTEPVSVRPQPTARPRQPKPIPQKDHYSDDLAKKFQAKLPKDSKVLISATTGQVVSWSLAGEDALPVANPHLLDPEHRLGSYSEQELVLGPDGTLEPLHSAGEYKLQMQAA